MCCSNLAGMAIRTSLISSFGSSFSDGRAIWSISVDGPEVCKAPR